MPNGKAFPFLDSNFRGSKKSKAKFGGIICGFHSVEHRISFAVHSSEFYPKKISCTPGNRIRIFTPLYDWHCLFTILFFTSIIFKVLWF